MTITDSRPAKLSAAPNVEPPAGPDLPPANIEPVPMVPTPAAQDSLGGQTGPDAQCSSAAEGMTSPRAVVPPTPKYAAPAGNETSRSQTGFDIHSGPAAADSTPGGHRRFDAHSTAAAGEQIPSAAIEPAQSIQPALLADPLLALAADVLGDLEKVRIANENRLRQLTRSEEDSDGEVRGFGLDEANPDVARLAALVGMLADAEHKATLNLQRLMRRHPLGPWVARQKGVGEKQGARLIAAIGDPYIRPEIALEDGTVEPSRARTVSELWALCGYHVIPVGHDSYDTQATVADGELDGGGSGHNPTGDHGRSAGVAPKRQRGQRANWSATAKMRAYLVAKSCIKKTDGPYRPVYDAARAKYADAVHAAECVRCGPSGKPAKPGSPLSDGHKHARALRAVAKEVLKDLWREAKRIHEETPGGAGTELPPATNRTTPRCPSSAEPR